MVDKFDHIHIVAAIDVGTTYSGYAFSLSRDELRFYGPQVWNSGHGDHFLKTICDRGNPNDIKFVLTVPAIWKDRSKQFMRAAAVQAGIDDAQLTLALVPEAASIYCHRESLEKMRVGRQSEITIPGTRYMVVDIGGGTADFSVHEVEDGGTLTDIYRASGGPYGGIYVDKEYLKMYETIFGEEAMNKLKEADMSEYLTIIREFEAKKRTVKANYGSNFVTRLSGVLNEMVSNEEKMRKIQSSYLKDKVYLVKDKLKLSPTLMESFFKDSLENIIDHVKNILRSIENVRLILLVGGYAEIPLAQEKFKNEFANLEIIIPQDCNQVVMKGAVLYGHSPLSISARILGFSYGICVSAPFDPKIHPFALHYLDDDGKSYCSNAFDELIAKNSKVPSTGTMVERNYSYEKTIKSGRLKVYCTEKENPTFVDEHCHLLGTLNVSIPREILYEWYIHGEFIFGMTEVKVSVTVKHLRKL